MQQPSGEQRDGGRHRQRPTTEPTLPPFLTVREAAALLRLNPKTVCGAVVAGQLGHVRVCRKILIRRDAIAGGAETRLGAGGSPDRDRVPL
ncbi:MAG: helix-turn-helix domain-containing protein [Myxococcales bacterium]